MADTFDVLQDVRDALGLEPYRIYTDSRRLIPEAVLWGFASTCILEFLKGLVDFKTLGDEARKRIEACLFAWRNPKQFEPLVEASPPDELALKALSLLLTPLADGPAEDARRRLSAALLEVGLSPAAADDCALKIANVVTGYARDAR